MRRKSRYVPVLTVPRSSVHCPVVTTPLDRVQTPFAGSYTPDVSARQPGPRIHTVDVTRGVAMILMAIDHVRIYSGVPAGGPTFDVFFTRWITNFVPPPFHRLFCAHNLRRIDTQRP